VEDSHVAVLLEEIRGQFKAFGEGLTLAREQLGAKIDAVAADVAALKTDVSVLKTDVSVLKTDVSVLKTDMGDVKHRLARVEKHLNGASPPPRRRERSPPPPAAARSAIRLRLKRSRRSRSVTECTFPGWPPSGVENAMSTILSNETRDRIGRFLAGDDTLQQLRRWFRSSALTAVSDSGDADDEELVFAVELLLSELDHGDWTEDELRAKLKELIAEETKGQVEVQVYHSNALGATRESLEMVRLGSTDFVHLQNYGTGEVAAAVGVCGAHGVTVPIIRARAARTNNARRLLAESLVSLTGCLVDKWVK